MAATWTIFATDGRRISTACSLPSHVSATVSTAVPTSIPASTTTRIIVHDAAKSTTATSTHGNAKSSTLIHPLGRTPYQTPSEVLDSALFPAPGSPSAKTQAHAQPRTQRAQGRLHPHRRRAAAHRQDGAEKGRTSLPGAVVFVLVIQRIRRRGAADIDTGGARALRDALSVPGVSADGESVGRGGADEFPGAVEREWEWVCDWGGGRGEKC
tara:strand:- start:16991 stop:17626 length:636 start_codon:yes stop_codon:yes gene_type:complete